MPTGRFPLPPRGYPAPDRGTRAREQARIATITGRRTRADPPVPRRKPRGGCPASPRPPREADLARLASRRERFARRCAWLSPCSPQVLASVLAPVPASPLPGFDNLHHIECPMLPVICYRTKDLCRAASANIPYISCQNSQACANKGLRRIVARGARCVRSAQGPRVGTQDAGRSERNVHLARDARGARPVQGAPGRGAEGAHDSHSSPASVEVGARARVRKRLSRKRIAPLSPEERREKLRSRPRRARHQK